MSNQQSAVTPRPAIRGMETAVDHAAEPLVPAVSVDTLLERLPQPVAVTGGTGFVGSHLVDTLCAGGLRPRVLVRDPDAPRWIAGRPVEWVPGSLEDPQALGRLVAGAKTVFHLAGVVRASRAGDFERGNREGTARVVAAIQSEAPSALLVHVSSLAAVGPSPDRSGVAPDTQPRPVSHYGRSKLGAELEVRRLGAPASWIILRPPAIYGPRDTDVYEFFRMASAGLVTVPSGERWLTVSHVADVVRAVLASAMVDPGQVLHPGEPEPYRMCDLIRTLADSGGVRVRILPVPAALVRLVGLAGGALRRAGVVGEALTLDKAREILARHWTAATRRSLQELGIADWTDFATGSRNTWGWYRGQQWLS
jgi:nucleoside-diphosphate-sugar epimerase